MSSVGFFVDDVDDVVDGEHADQALVLVDHRDLDEVVALEVARRFFLVLGGLAPG